MKQQILETAKQLLKENKFADLDDLIVRCKEKNITTDEDFIFNTIQNSKYNTLISSCGI